jgi:hypothetical protein
MKKKLLILAIIVYFLEEYNLNYYYMYSLFDSSLNLLDNKKESFDLSLNMLNDMLINKQTKQQESFDISSNFLDKTDEFFTPYKKALTALFVLLIILYIIMSSNMMGFSKMNLYIHLIYSLVLIYIFLLLIT